MEREIRLKNIKENIKKLPENNNYLIKYCIDNDTNGYLYCITNNIFNVYNIETYKIGNSCNLIKRFKIYNNSYLELINIKNLVNVPFKTMFETLIFKKLKSYRLSFCREFFTNYENINNEFIKINEIVSNNNEIDALEKYYLYVIENDFIHNEKSIDNIHMNKKVEYNLVKLNYGLKIKNKIINYNEKKSKGFILHLDMPEIRYNFDNNIKTVLMTKKKSISFTEFLGKPTLISSLKVYDIKLARLLFYDMLNGTHIKNKYFECSQELLENTINRIREYFNKYSNSDKIKKAYLYDYYNIGEKIIPDKNKEKITDENFELHYGSYFDILKKKISKYDNIDVYDIDNIIDNEINNSDLDKTNDDKEIENLIKDKINMIKEIQRKYKTRQDKYLKLYDSDNSSEDELYKKLSKVHKNTDNVEKKFIHSNIYMSKFERLKEMISDDEIEIKPKINIVSNLNIKNNEEFVKILKQTYKSRTEKYKCYDEY